MAQRFLALLALRLALACKEEACEGDEGASLMQLQQPKQQVELVSLSSLSSRKRLEDWKVSCKGSTPPAFDARLDGRKLSEASLPVNVSAGSELVIMGCNLEVGALGSGPFVSALGEGAKLSVFFYGSFNKKVVGRDYVPLEPLPENAASFVESESARFEGRLADAQSRWAARGDGCPELPADAPFPFQALGAAGAAEAPATAPRSDDDDEGAGSLLEKKKETKAKKAAVRVVVQPSVFPPVLVGPVGSGARVEITVKESANVEVKGGSVTVSGGSLMGSMVRAEGTLENVVMRVTLQESAKVDADNELLIFNGSLTAPVISAEGYNLADIQVTLEEVANVDATNVTLVDPNSPLTATVFAGEEAGINESDAHLSLEDTANIRAVNLRFVGEDNPFELAQTVVVMNEIMNFPFLAPGMHSHVSAVLKETANAHLKGSILGRGHLFNEVLDLGAFENCKVETYLEDSGNAYAASRVSEGSPPWINDIVHLDEAGDTVVKAKVEESCNQRVGLLEVLQAISTRGFVDEVVDVANEDALQNVHIDVRTDDSLNWYGEVLDMRDTSIELVENAVDVDGTLARGSSVKVFMSKSANAFGDDKSAVCLRDELIDDAVVLERVKDSSVSVRVLDSANVEANYFHMAEEDLIDAVLDVNRLVTDSKISVKLERSCNVKAATVNLTDSGELLEQTISTENLEGAETSVSVYVSKSGNAAAYSLYMEDGSYLIEHGASLEFRNRSAENIAVDLSFVGSANALAKEATLRQRSRLFNDVLEIDDRTTDLPDTRLYVKECGNLGVQRAGRLRGNSHLIGSFVEQPGNASTLEKLEVLFSGVAKGPVSFSNNSANCRDDFEVHPSSCRGP